MFCSPSEPSPFSSTRCPYDTQARCGRPYCPFAHQADDTVAVVEDTANDVLVLDSDHLSDGGRSSVGTEIRQKNPTDQFSGCYMSNVSKTTSDGHHPSVFPPSTAVPAQPQVQQQQRPKRPHRCAKCPKKFVKFSGLQRHYITHTNLKQFKCKLCPYESNQKEHLERHMSIHRYGEKCRFCGAPIVPQWFKHHEKTCAAAEERFSQLQNDQKKLLEKINELEKQQKEHWMSFGFAVKQQNKLDGTIRTRNGTYAIDSDGKIWINGKEKGINDEYCYGEGDTMGIGVNLATRQIIFTKNGHRLDSSGLLVASSFGDDSFHPFVSLHDSGDKIEANFGANFKFDLDAF
ncbi:hypothetical protein niasHT_000163 [Heterodera trifolii]|uniref:C2H2-type domain-containing protein n=1 Tax=Heterodera trifolii TaxID=157864 RepID=A0ABD2LQ88_9BILA